MNTTKPQWSTIVDVRHSPLDVELTEPFGIATGAQVMARNVLVEIELRDGTVGLGEAAPFEAVSGETQAKVLASLKNVASGWIGESALRFRQLSDQLWDMCPDVPTAIAGLEMALFDALARSRGLSLLDWFGRSELVLHTDITIPTTSARDPVAAAVDAARRAAAGGFTTLKLKVGKDPLDVEVRRVLSVARAAPGASLVLDANAGYSAAVAIALLQQLAEVRPRIATFEQPVARDDWDGLMEVERVGGVPVCADESVRSLADLRDLARRGGPSVVNIKTAKFGFVRAWDMAVTARTLGFRLMIGGMVETELAMSASACLAAGLGGFEFVDLDTPLFMRERPLSGGFAQSGPRLDLTAIDFGHGVRRTV
jgi:L-alanine-DL-glutamate epimerase-like enolase superfamily enzyme